MFHGHLDYFQKPPLESRPNTKPGDHGTPNAHNRWLTLFYHVWGPAWIKFIETTFGWGPGHIIWLHTTLEGPWPYHISLEVCQDGRPLDSFFRALTISWSQHLHTPPNRLVRATSERLPPAGGHFQSYFSQWEPLVATNAGTPRSLLGCTSRCGECISSCVKWRADHTGHLKHHPLASLIVNSVKIGGPTCKFEHNPQQFHGWWNQTERLMWSGHDP